MLRRYRASAGVVLERSRNSVGSQLCSKAGCRVGQLRSWHIVLLVGKVEVRHLIGWNAMQVNMIDLEPCDDESDAVGAERDTLSQCHAATDVKDVRIEIGWHVHPVIDGLAWYHQRMTRSNRGNGHEHHAVLVLQCEMSGKFAGDDPGKE